MGSEERRVRLTEGDAIEEGIRCPNCGGYNAFGDIIATGRCRNGWGASEDDCGTELALDLVVTDP